MSAQPAKVANWQAFEDYRRRGSKCSNEFNNLRSVRCSSDDDSSVIAELGSPNGSADEVWGSGAFDVTGTTLLRSSRLGSCTSRGAGIRLLMEEASPGKPLHVRMVASEDT